MNKALFNITLIQDEAGVVYVMADHCGDKGMALEIGIEIMQNLAAVARTNARKIEVSPTIFSSQSIQ